MVTSPTALPGTLSMRTFDSQDALAVAVADAVQAALAPALADGGRASMLVTGGSTPRGYYPRMVGLNLPWERVTLMLSDERLVPADHPERNERLVRALLLQDRAAAATLVPLLVDGEPDPVAGANRRLHGIGGPHALALLGLGEDSHLASLFPAAAGIQEVIDVHAAARCVRIAPPPGVLPALPRLSLNLPALLASGRILIAAQGESKRAAFERAARGQWPAPSPLHALALHARQPVDFYWCA